jgi:transcriptional regulator with XRE-family HTH domain
VGRIRSGSGTEVVGVDDEYVKADRLAAELLRTTRRERGLTQLDVADEMAERGFRWSQPTVARVENGRRQLSFAESRALMDLLELNEGSAYRRIEPI